MAGNAVHFLVYISVASHPFSEPELVELLRTSRSLNEQSDITGMLLYNDERFMQVLEGGEEEVKATFARISNDSRHQNVITLLEGEQPERDFPQWWMGFKVIDAETVKALPGFHTFLTQKWSALQFADDPSRAHQLLRVFRRM